MSERASTTPLERARVQRERLAEAADALERALTRPAADGKAWRDGTGSALGEVRAALAAHVDAVESEDGLYTEIMIRSARLAHAIDRLRSDHTKLGDEISELDALVRSPDATVDDVRESTLVLLADISRHRHQGANLVWDSYALDIGEGD
jgi:hypothetical protein